MNRTTIFRTVMVLLAGVLLTGCGQGTITNGQAQLVSGESSAAFLDRMADESLVTQNDAMRGMVMLIDGDDTFDTFQDRVTYLQGLSVVPTSWNLDASGFLTRGQLAYMSYVASEMSGGVWLTVAGPSQRYCLREMQYRGVMGEGSLLSSVGGLEYITTLGRMAVYIEAGDVPDPAGDLPSDY